MDRFIGYIKGIQKHELIIKKQTELSNVSYCDFRNEDFRDARESIMGEIKNIGWAVMSCKSQQQNTGY